jgi:hypothetical protein
LILENLKSRLSSSILILVEYEVAIYRSRISHGALGKTIDISMSTKDSPSVSL